MAIFKGAGVAIVTPMKEDGSVNFDKLQETIDFQIENSTDCIVICGTTGESSTLTEEEHSETVDFAVKATKKRVPVIAGTGSNCTQTTIKLSKEAQASGADGLLIVTPYYNKATQKGLINHYTAVAKSVDVPIVMYNVPSRTGCNIMPQTAAALAKDVDNIVAIKEASGNISQVAQTAMLTEGNLDIYSGNDDQIAPIMSLGGLGVISVLSNIAPQQTHDICAAYLDGDAKKCTKLQLEALNLINNLFSEVNPIPVKTAMNLMGMDVGALRMPLSPMEPENLEKLKKAIVDYGLKLA